VSGIQKVAVPITRQSDQVAGSRKPRDDEVDVYALTPPGKVRTVRTVGMKRRLGLHVCNDCRQPFDKLKAF
jgi:hypothetical protein